MLQTENGIDLPSKHTINAPFTESLYKYHADLNWWSIHALFDHQDFNPSYRWIASQVGCNVEKVSEAIEGLITLGIVKRTEDGFAIVKRDVKLADIGEIPREYRIDTNIALAQQIANKRNYIATGFDKVAVVASNQELVYELFDKLSAALAEFRKKSLECKKDGIYSVSLMSTDIKTGDL